MHAFHLFVRKVVYITLLTSMHLSKCWVVKVLNLTDEKITINIQSTQSYPGWSAGKLVKRNCEFIDKQIAPHASQDFDYKKINAICMAPCTKSVSITSPVQL